MGRCKRSTAPCPALDLVAADIDIQAMNREGVIAYLRALQPRLNAEGIARLYLFGSVLHGKETADSDVDLFFESDDPRFNILDYVHAREVASAILPWKVDLIERSCLHRSIREKVEAEAIRVF